MATAKKATASKVKEQWAYLIDNNDESYTLYPSRAAALKAAKQELADDFSGVNKATINLYQKVEVIKVEVVVEEVSVEVVKKVTNIKELE